VVEIDHPINILIVLNCVGDLTSMGKLNVNKVIIVGTLERDPNIGQTKNDKKVANLLVVTDESYTNNEKVIIEKYEKHKIVAWGRQAENCQNFKKGDKVYIEGKNQTRRTESSVITEVVATLVQK
jgi:single stranded DNA-binding protein